MSSYKILFFPRYSNPFDAVPYNDEVDFDAQSIGDAVKTLKKNLDSFSTGRGYSRFDVKAYLLKHNPHAVKERSGRVREWTWMKAATYPHRGARGIKVYNLGKHHTEESDPTISYMNLGRRNFPY